MVDVWESSEDFDRFAQERLMPAVREVGIGGEPKVEFYPTHAVFQPGVAARA